MKAWYSLCFKCGGAIPHEPKDDPLGSDNCVDCPHCGDHKCGARQMQLGEPCLKEVALAQKT